jgi:hypothetical protein
MNRREFLKSFPFKGICVVTAASAFPDHALLGAIPEKAAGWLDAAKSKEWLDRWEINILGDARSRYCDKETGEELGWLVSPFLNGFYYGYLATREPKWTERFIDWSDSCVKRGVKEPDGFIGWPKGDGGGGVHL